MKISSKVTVLSSLAALVAGPYALGNEPVVTVCPEFPVPEVQICVFEIPPSIEEVTPVGCIPWVTPPTGELPVVEIDGSEGAVTENLDPTDPVVDVTVTDDVTEIPIDWVKRTDTDGSEVIYQSMAGGPAPTSVGGGNSGITRSTEQDEQSTAILSKNTVEAAQIDHEKQGPTALVNAGRVFLR